LSVTAKQGKPSGGWEKGGTEKSRVVEGRGEQGKSALKTCYTHWKKRGKNGGTRTGSKLGQRHGDKG